MKVSEAIEDLEKKRDNALSFRNLYAPAESGWNANQQKADVYSAAIRVVKQIDEPQAEKVVVTEKQAELLRAFKGESIYELLTNCLVEDEELMAKARLFGYTVKPKRWVVKAGDYHSTYVDSLTITSEKSRHTISGKEKAHYFTDRAKAEAVAVLVEGSVEEI